MMNALSLSILSVMFLLEPEERVDVARMREISRDADRVGTDGTSGAPKESGRHARITSTTGDFDHREKVALFEGDVVLAYSDDCVLCADRLWAFAVGSNQLDRVEVEGNVSITNETRVGTCSRAVFRRGRGEIEMFSDGGAALARLVEQGRDASALEGARIRFWIDTEQVEVDSPRITTQSQSNGSFIR